MSRRELRCTNSFFVSAEDGEPYEVLEFTPTTITQTSTGQCRGTGAVRLETACGLPVRRVSDGVYQILVEAEWIRTTRD